jgi:hypothetical protein
MVSGVGFQVPDLRFAVNIESEIIHRGGVGNVEKTNEDSPVVPK